MSSSDIEDQLRARNAEIGQLLRRAREAAGRTQAECAAFLNISRQRYNRLENARQVIGVAEYEALRAYLGAESHFSSTLGYKGEDSKDVFIEAQPGQTVHISVHIAETSR